MNKQDEKKNDVQQGKATEQVSFRASASEKQQILDHAKALGLSVAEYCRTLVMASHQNNTHDDGEVSNDTKSKSPELHIVTDEHDGEINEPHTETNMNPDDNPEAFADENTMESEETKTEPDETTQEVPEKYTYTIVVSHDCDTILKDTLAYRKEKELTNDMGELIEQMAEYVAKAMFFKTPKFDFPNDDMIRMGFEEPRPVSSYK